jgi:hypothetical protein
MDEQPQHGLLGAIHSNTTDAGGPLTEDEFLHAMQKVAGDPVYRPGMFMVSRATVDRALNAADRAEARAADLERELATLRRWRWVRRRKVRRELGERLATADALNRTFGRLRRAS